MSIQDEVAEMYAAGMTAEAIADELGRSVHTVNQYLWKLGIKKGPSSPVDKLTADQRDELVKEYTSTDIPASSLLRKYGIGYMALYRLLREAGVQHRSADPAVQQAYQDRLDHAVEMYEAGAKIVVIEVETGIASARLYKELAVRQIPLRTGHL